MDGKIYTKSILKPRDCFGGIRISVMSRHTLNDGFTYDDRINSDSYDLWMSELAPSSDLVGAYYRKEISWNNYKLNYLLSLRKNKMGDINNLISLAMSNNVTLLCVEDSADFCHRRLLAEECKFYEPKLEVIHL